MTWQKIHPPVVRSLLENDLYKFTMWQALLHSHPGAQAEYAFFCRNRSSAWSVPYPPTP